MASCAPPLIHASAPGDHLPSLTLAQLQFLQHDLRQLFMRVRSGVHLLLVGRCYDPRGILMSAEVKVWRVEDTLDALLLLLVERRMV